jgi:hypothetical protein
VRADNNNGLLEIFIPRYIQRSKVRIDRAFRPGDTAKCIRTGVRAGEVFGVVLAGVLQGHRTQFFHNIFVNDAKCLPLYHTTRGRVETQEGVYFSLNE